MRFLSLIVSVCLFTNSLGGSSSYCVASPRQGGYFTAQALEAPGAFFQIVFSLFPRVSISHTYATLGPGMPGPDLFHAEQPFQTRVYLAEGSAKKSPRDTPSEARNNPAPSIKAVVDLLTKMHLNEQVSEALLALRGIKPGQHSLHIGSGVSMLPVAEALLGASVLAIDKDPTMSEVMPVLLRNIDIEGLTGKSGGSFRYDENVWSVLHGSFDHITAIGICLSEIDTEADARQFAEWILDNLAPSGSVLFSIGIPHRGTAMVLEALKTLGAKFESRTVEKLIDYYLEPVWLLQNIRTDDKNVFPDPAQEETQREARIRLFLSALNDLRHLYVDFIGGYDLSKYNEILQDLSFPPQENWNHSFDAEIRDALGRLIHKWQAEKTGFDHRLTAVDCLIAFVQAMPYGVTLEFTEDILFNAPAGKVDRSKPRLKASSREANAFLRDFLERLGQAKTPEEFQFLFSDIKQRLSLDAQDFLEENFLLRVSNRHVQGFFEILVGCALFIGEQSQVRKILFDEKTLGTLDKAVQAYNRSDSRVPRTPLSVTTLFSYAVSPYDRGAALPRVLKGLLKLPPAYRDRFMAFHLQQLAWHGDDKGYDTELTYTLLKAALEHLGAAADLRTELELGIGMAVLIHDSTPIRDLIGRYADIVIRIVRSLYEAESRTGVYISSIAFLYGTLIATRFRFPVSFDALTLDPWNPAHKEALEDMLRRSDPMQLMGWKQRYTVFLARMGSLPTAEKATPSPSQKILSTAA